MSRPWLLRHKLILGLALVVASVAILLGGALLGLSSYFRTMDTTQRKIDEMQVVVQLRDHIHKLGESRPRDMDLATTARDKNLATTALESDRHQILADLGKCRDDLNLYRTTLTNETLRRNLDPEGGHDELALIARIDQSFAALEENVRKETLSGSDIEGDKPLAQRESVQKSLIELNRFATDLFYFLVADVRVSFDASRANHRRSLMITGSATGLSLILVGTLLFYFREWVFKPIRLLQAGVRRVQNGNFDQPIRIDSHDELEELAEEFNGMTVRLRDIYKDLAHQVNERTRQLVRSERMVSVGFLAAGVAHEINNPLASIAFCSESLERRLLEILGKNTADTEVVSKYLRMIQQEAFRCKQITQKLLDFSRSGGRREPTELSGLITDVLEVAQHLPNARGKRLVFEPDASVMAIVSGPDIKSVVLNMVVNALDSMEDGGSLTATLQADDDTAEMTFTDTGVGMTPEVLDNIFEPFFTRNRLGNGTGLGLSISHQIIDQHGGTIHAHSQGPGHGSTFVVRIPLRAVETKPEPAKTQSDSEIDVIPFRTAA